MSADKSSSVGLSDKTRERVALVVIPLSSDHSAHHWFVQRPDGAYVTLDTTISRGKSVSLIADTWWKYSNFYTMIVAKTSCCSGRTAHNRSYECRYKPDWTATPKLRSSNIDPCTCGRTRPAECTSSKTNY